MNDDLISTAGIHTFVVCRRMWMLANQLEHDPEPDLTEAQAALAQRRARSERLAAVGAVFLVIALLMLVVGALVG